MQELREDREEKRKDTVKKRRDWRIEGRVREEKREERMGRKRMGGLGEKNGGEGEPLGLKRNK